MILNMEKEENPHMPNVFLFIESWSLWLQNKTEGVYFCYWGTFFSFWCDHVIISSKVVLSQIENILVEVTKMKIVKMT